MRLFPASGGNSALSHQGEVQDKLSTGSPRAAKAAGAHGGKLVSLLLPTLRLQAAMD